MTAVVITLNDAQTAFLPSHTIVGSVMWSVPEVPRSVEVRLGWKTSGKGDADSAVVQRVELGNGRTQSTRPFQFVAPEGPYSFSGRLVSLIWAIEVVVMPGSHTARREIVISPTGAEIELYPESPENADAPTT